MSSREEQLTALREELGTLKCGQWIRANCIMDNIVALGGYKRSRNKWNIKVMPRCCAFCGYFGHTKQFCEVRKTKEAADEARELKKARRELEAISEELSRARSKKPWRSREQQFDDEGIAYVTSPSGTGPYPVYFTPGLGEGKWVLNEACDGYVPKEASSIAQ